MKRSVFDTLEQVVRKCWGVSLWCCVALFLGTGFIMLSEYSNRLLLTGVLTLLSGAAIGITVSFLLVIKAINELKRNEVYLKEPMQFGRHEG